MKSNLDQWQSRRSAIWARRGMVATSHPLAAEAGLSILRAGGNAADAAIATAAVLAVVESAATGLGGDCFALYYDARSSQISALNGSGRAPAALTLDQVQGWPEIPARHVYAITVPGSVMGWADLLGRHGSLGLRDVLAEAIYHARAGFPVSPVYAAAWQRLTPILQNGQHNAEYLPQGIAPRAGQIVQLPALADTLERIAQEGAAGFYQGAVAQAIVETIQARGGLMTLADLAAHHSTWENPIAADYHGVQVIECPPNGQGLAVLQALNILEGFDLKAAPWDAPERLHLLIEAMRLAFADARHYIADPDHAAIPLDRLLDKKYAAERRRLIQPQTALAAPPAGGPFPASDTVYLSVIDGWGNACSFINSLYMGFGTGIAARGTGVFLQNRGALFSTQADHPNALAPGKRPFHTIIPGMILREGALWSSFGVMGGFMQPQGHVQMVDALVNGGLDPQAALDRPRWCLTAGTSGSAVALEEGLPFSTLAALAEWGHEVIPTSGAGRAVFGCGQIICRDLHSGVLIGGSDPRKDGQAVGF